MKNPTTKSPQILTPHWSVYLMVAILFGIIPAIATFGFIVDPVRALNEGLIWGLVLGYALFLFGYYYFIFPKISIYPDKLVYRYPFTKTKTIKLSDISKVEVRTSFPIHEEAHKFMQGKSLMRLHIFDKRNQEILVINLSIYDKLELAILINTIAGQVSNLKMDDGAERLGKGHVRKVNKEVYKHLMMGLVLIYGTVLMIALIRKFLEWYVF